MVKVKMIFSCIKSGSPTSRDIQLGIGAGGDARLEKKGEGGGGRAGAVGPLVGLLNSQVDKLRSPESPGSENRESLDAAGGVERCILW